MASEKPNQAPESNPVDTPQDVKDPQTKKKKSWAERIRSGADRKLGNRPSSSDRASQLNEARRSRFSRSSGQPGSQGNEQPDAEQPQTLREQQLAAKREQAEEEKKKPTKADQAISAMAAPIKKGTSNLLRQAWLNLIDSFGLTLIWINIHVFLWNLFGDRFFTQPGGEWLDQISAGVKSAPIPKEGAGGAAQEAEKKIEDSVNKITGPVECMGIACCDLGCLFLVLINLGLIAMIVGFIENPLRAIFDILKSIIGNLWK